MKMTILLTILIAMISQFMAGEMEAWFGWLHKRIRRAALGVLPSACRERYDEEWESALDEVPGEIFKLLYSIDLFRAAVGIRISARSLSNERAHSDFFKRSFDVVFASAFLVLFAPTMILIAIAIRASSQGPAIYHSERLGKHGRVFNCLKFRTMSFNTRDDIRVNALGRFLRRYSLDELPQFINVLKGDMSIIGPRPVTPREILKRDTDEIHFFGVAPGITGIWQIEDEGTVYPQALESLDRAYVRNRNFWLDMKILLTTVAVVLVRAGRSRSSARKK